MAPTTGATLRRCRPEIEATLAIETFEALDEATRAIAEVLDLEAVLQLIVDRVRTLVDARYAALGIADSKGRIERFITAGITPRSGRGSGRRREGHGLLASDHPRGPVLPDPGHRRAPGLVRVPAEPSADALAPRRPDHRPRAGRSATSTSPTRRAGPSSTSTDQRVVELFARHAGVAIENARLHDRVATLAVVEERDRIGRDLHDGIIQSLYARRSLARGPRVDDDRSAGARPPLASTPRSTRSTRRSATSASSSWASDRP